MPSASEKLNVLVLGVGGNVSQGILKALAMSSLNVKVIGACISHMSPGLYLTQHSYVCPTAADPGFIDWVIKTCTTERIDAVLSGVEQNLAVIAQHRDEIRRQCGAECIVSSPATLAIGDDKLRTCQWLEENGLNFPRYAPAEDKQAVEKLVSECGFNLIGKPRRSRGGAGIIKIQDEPGLYYATTRSDYVIEECLGNDESEYTVGCFSDKNYTVCSTIAAKRELQQGTTYKAELGDYPEVRQEARRIAEKLKPVGPLNVQMRITNDGRPVCFELNIRFSGTTPVRARLGWNDVEQALRHYVLGQTKVQLPEVTTGIALRYWNELYVDEKQAEQLRQHGKLDSPPVEELVRAHGG